MKRLKIQALILMALFLLLPASAEAASEKYRAYTIAEEGGLAYSEPSLLTGKLKFILSGNYEAHIVSVTGKFAALSVSGQKNLVYTPTSMFLLKASGWKTTFSSSSFAAYRRKSTADRYGSIAQFDKVYVVGRDGSYTQVVYPAAGKSYMKIAWIPTASEKQFLTDAPTAIQRKRDSSLAVKAGTKVKLTYLVEVLPKKALQAVDVKIANPSVMKRDGQFLVPLKNGTTKVTLSTLNGYSCTYTFTVSGFKSTLISDADIQKWAASYQISRGSNAWKALESINTKYASRLTDAQKKGTLVFLFEGCGSNSSANKRMYAMCVVVRDKKIVYLNRNSSTLPDCPFKPSLNGGDPVPTLVSGIYSINACHHHGKYAALNVVSAKVVRFRSKTNFYTDSKRAETINVHRRTSDSIITSGKPNSTGCINIGRAGTSSTGEYARFIQKTGLVGSSASGTARLKYKSQGQYVGKIIVDRTYAADYLKRIGYPAKAVSLI